VFFGYATDTTGENVTLTNARNCVYWSSDCKGFMGLAEKGPTVGCRVGPQVKSIDLRKVTAVLEVSDEAVESWEGAPWRS